MVIEIEADDDVGGIFGEQPEQALALAQRRLGGTLFADIAYKAGKAGNRVALAMLGYLGSYFDPRVKGGAMSSEWAARVDARSVMTRVAAGETSRDVILSEAKDLHL